MGLREVMNKNPAVGAAVVIVIVGVAAAVVFNASSGEPLRDQGWYYDLKTGDLFQADRFSLPPIAAPSGGLTGVHAVVLGCGSCSDSPTKAAWIEKLSTEALAIQKKIDAIAADTSDNPPTLTDAEQTTYDDGHLMALPPKAGDDPQWISARSDTGQDLQQSVLQHACADGERPQLCVPIP